MLEEHETRHVPTAAIVKVAIHQEDKHRSSVYATGLPLPVALHLRDMSQALEAELA